MQYRPLQVETLDILGPRLVVDRPACDADGPTPKEVGSHESELMISLVFRKWSVVAVGLAKSLTGGLHGRKLNHMRVWNCDDQGKHARTREVVACEKANETGAIAIKNVASAGREVIGRGLMSRILSTANSPRRDDPRV
jgi:hypothetical protein